MTYLPTDRPGACLACCAACGAPVTVPMAAGVPPTIHHTRVCPRADWPVLDAPLDSEGEQMLTRDWNGVACRSCDRELTVAAAYDPESDPLAVNDCPGCGAPDCTPATCPAKP